MQLASKARVPLQPVFTWPGPSRFVSEPIPNLVSVGCVLAVRCWLSMAQCVTGLHVTAATIVLRTAELSQHAHCVVCRRCFGGIRRKRS